MTKPLFGKLAVGRICNGERRGGTSPFYVCRMMGVLMQTGNFPMVKTLRNLETPKDPRADKRGLNSGLPFPEDVGNKMQ